MSTSLDPLLVGRLPDQLAIFSPIPASALSLPQLVQRIRHHSPSSSPSHSRFEVVKALWKVHMSIFHTQCGIDLHIQAIRPGGQPWEAELGPSSTTSPLLLGSRSVGGHGADTLLYVSSLYALPAGQGAGPERGRLLLARSCACSTIEAAEEVAVAQALLLLLSRSCHWNLAKACECPVKHAYPIDTRDNVFELNGQTLMEQAMELLSAAQTTRPTAEVRRYVSPDADWTKYAGNDRRVTPEFEALMAAKRALGRGAAGAQDESGGESIGYWWRLYNTTSSSSSAAPCCPTVEGDPLHWCRWVGPQDGQRQLRYVAEFAQLTFDIYGTPAGGAHRRRRSSSAPLLSVTTAYDGEPATRVVYRGLLAAARALHCSELMEALFREFALTLVPPPFLDDVEAYFHFYYASFFGCATNPPSSPRSCGTATIPSVASAPLLPTHSFPSFTSNVSCNANAIGEAPPLRSGTPAACAASARRTVGADGSAPHGLAWEGAVFLSPTTLPVRLVVVRAAQQGTALLHASVLCGMMNFDFAMQEMERFLSDRSNCRNLDLQRETHLHAMQHTVQQLTHGAAALLPEVFFTLGNKCCASTVPQRDESKQTSSSCKMVLSPVTLKPPPITPLARSGAAHLTVSAHTSSSSHPPSTVPSVGMEGLPPPSGDEASRLDETWPASTPPTVSSSSSSSSTRTAIRVLQHGFQPFYALALEADSEVDGVVSTIRLFHCTELQSFHAAQSDGRDGGSEAVTVLQRRCAAQDAGEGETSIQHVHTAAFSLEGCGRTTEESLQRAVVKTLVLFCSFRRMLGELPFISVAQAELQLPPDPTSS